jgi:hypothetical protein
MFPPEVGLTAEDSVLESWTEQAASAQQALIAGGVIGSDVETIIGSGRGWRDSMVSIN